MSDRQRIWAIGGWGVLTAVVLGVGAGTLGGIMALVQLCLLVGAPVAVLVADDLRSRAATVVVAAVLSLAISAIAVQSLVWFRLASAELIVLLATVYGVVLALLLAANGAGGREIATSAPEVERW